MGCRPDGASVGGWVLAIAGALLWYGVGAGVGVLVPHRVVAAAALGLTGLSGAVGAVHAAARWRRRGQHTLRCTVHAVPVGFLLPLQAVPALGQIALEIGAVFT